jgi:flagellar basal-body rod modification protein FlgD
VSAASSAAASASATRGMNSMRSEDFFKILVTELQQQDPLEPAKTADMIGQVSQIRNIELSSQLNTVLTQLSRAQRVNGAGELLGKYVTASVQAQDGSTQQVSGLVTGIRFDPSGAMVLELDSGDSVLASDVTRIASQESPADPALATSAGQTPAAGTQDAATQGAKSGSAKKQRSKGLLPWLSLDGIFHL